MKKNLFSTAVVIMLAVNCNAQLKNIFKQKAAEGVKQAAQNSTEKAADKAVDKIFSKKNKKNKNEETTSENNDNTNQKGKDIQKQPFLKTYSKYDFVPGEKVVGYADFSQDAIGDFPNHWNTNGTGEVMTVEGKAGKWLSVGKEGFYIPVFINSLPENFTLEYDVIHIPSAAPGTSASGFQLVRMDMKKESFEGGLTRAQFQIDPYLGNFDYESYTKYENGKGGDKILSSSTHVDGLNNRQIHSYHVSVWRQKQRVRVYLDQNKVCDLPMVLSETEKYNAIRFVTARFNDGSNWLISNIKLAAGAPDTRNKLMTTGKFSTTGILFAANSASIQPQSYGTLKEIAAVLKENNGLQVKIIGHTDSDGDDAANLELSKKRAEAVKATLTKEFGIEESRMQADGKGETQPAAANTTPEGKAQNRRVEFIKI